MATTVRKKTADSDSMQDNVFEGISAVFAVAGGFTFSNGALNLPNANVRLLEFPCSEDSGFSFDTGAPSMALIASAVLTAATRLFICFAVINYDLPSPSALRYVCIYAQRIICVSLKNGKNLIS